jgi:Ca-activated chloride channel family protein
MSHAHRTRRPPHPADHVRHDEVARFPRRTFLGALVAAVIGEVGVLAAQEFRAGQTHARFGSGIDLVTLHVTVTDGSGKVLSDIGEHEFLVFENGRRQDVTVFEKGGLPLAVTLLLDTSSSMQRAFPEVQAAALTFLRQLRPQDIASVVAFGDDVRVLQGFTTDHAALEEAVRQAKPRGETALYTAMYIALKELNRTAADGDVDGIVPRRRVAVVLSDGDDTRSLVTFDDVLDLATRSDTAIYAIRMGTVESARRERGEAEVVLRRLTQRTGGRAFLSLQRDELRGVYEDIRTELARQYSLAYVSSDARKDGQFRVLSVHVQRPGAHARARQGYIQSAGSFR